MCKKCHFDIHEVSKARYLGGGTPSPARSLCSLAHNTQQTNKQNIVNLKAVYHCVGLVDEGVEKYNLGCYCTSKSTDIIFEHPVLR